MGTSLDVLNAPQSLTARRQANLPNFELPPPTNLQFTTNVTQKFPPITNINVTHATPANVSVGNLLTPPSNPTSDNTSPVPSGLNSASNPSNQGVLPYTPSFWPTGTTPGGFNTGYTPQPWQASNPLFPPRGMFSPSLNSLMRNSNNCPSAGDSQPLPPLPYDLNPLPPFQTPLSMTASSMPASSTQQQHAMAHAMMNSHTTSNTQSSPINTSDSISQKAPPTPSLYGGPSPSATPQHTSFSYSGSSAVHQSPHSANAPISRISPPINQSPVGQNSAPNNFVRPPYPSYTLPAMPGAVMTNINSPGSHMSLVGQAQPNMNPGFNSGYAASTPNGMYGGQSHPHSQQAPTNDRPFKCDQCPQSFNRNHDLKRHKRIHLAVKPFPCTHCDKSFSRKDALKVGFDSPSDLALCVRLTWQQRHILVKGCGKCGEEGAAKDEDGSQNVKSESGTEEGEGSPELNGHS